MRLPHFVLFAILLSIDLAHAATPTPTPDRLTQMQQEIATLRAVQTLSRLNTAAPPTAEAQETLRKNYRDLIARYPDQAEPHVVYGEYLVQLGSNEAAFLEWNQALALDPKRPDILAAQSDLLIQTGQIAAAADVLEKAAVLDPKNAFYPYGLAHLYTLFRRDLIDSRKLTEEALITRGTEYFRQAAALAPENLAYAQAYAEAFYTQPNPDWTLARAAWEALLERSPEKDFIRGHLVRVNIRLRNKNAANQYLAAITSPAFAQMRERLQKQVDAL